MSKSTQYVNIWDPSGKLALGEIVEGDQRVALAKQGSSAVLLPTDPAVYYSASPGFVYRPWGKGWIYDSVLPERGCPMMLAVSEETTWVYWAMLVLPMRTEFPLHGALRMVGNSSAGVMSIGMAQDVRVPPLQDVKPGPKGGVVVGGRCHLGVVSPGVFGVSIHGIGRNCRVVWTAVSAASERVEVPDVLPV